MPTKTKQLFKGTQVQFYMIALMAWNFFRQQIAEFMLFDSRYTSQTANDAIDAVNAAKALKNIQQRNVVTSLNRNESMDANATLCELWQSLKRYILKSYKGQSGKDCLKAAGEAFYLKAAANDWSSVMSLIENSTTFMTDHQNELITKGGMPADFIKTFTVAAEKCSNDVTEFKTSVRKKNEQTITKQDANKAVFESLQAMLADGQDIFKKDLKSKNNYIYNKLYQVAKANSPASLRGYLTDANDKPLPGVKVQVENTELVAITNKKGYFRFARMSAGSSMITFKKAGLIDMFEGVILKAGTGKLLNVTMQPAIENEVRKIEAA